MKKTFNILIILAGLAMPHAAVQAYQTRGYFAIGGEWLLIPLVLLVYAVTIQLKLFWKECFKR